jgi:hypothetical protein
LKLALFKADKASSLNILKEYVEESEESPPAITALKINKIDPEEEVNDTDGLEAN